VNLVAHTGEETIHARAAPIQIGRAATDGMVTHQTLDPPPAHRFAVLPQTGMDTRAAIRLPAFVVHPTDALKQPRILPIPRAGWPVAPRVVPARTDTVEPAQKPHRVLLLLADESEDVGLGLEVNAIAFFKRSCSIFSCS